MTVKQILLLAFAIVMGSPAASLAQATLHGASGLTLADLRLPTSTSYGASILVGGGVNLGSHFSLLAEYGDAVVYRSQPTAGNVAIPSNSVRISDITFDPKLRIPVTENVQLYAIAGYGYYHSHNLVLGQKASGGGFNVGGGMEFKLDESVSLFWELRVHKAYTIGEGIMIIPVSFGVRWH